MWKNIACKGEPTFIYLLVDLFVEGVEEWKKDLHKIEWNIHRYRSW